MKLSSSAASKNSKSEVERLMREKDMTEVAVLHALKDKYDKRGKAEYDRWYDVELGITKYSWICKDSYRWLRDGRKMRGCVGLDPVVEQDLEVTDRNFRRRFGDRSSSSVSTLSLSPVRRS